MSLITPSVGNASDVTAHVPIEQQLDELGNRHRVALSQARVLDEVAKIAQASARRAGGGKTFNNGPGCALKGG